MTTQVASLEAVFTADTTNFDRGAQRVERGITGMGSRISGGMQNIGASITNVGSAITGLALPVAAAFGGAAMAAISFESAFAGVVKTVDASEAELDALNQTIRDMATDANNPLAGLNNAHETIANVMELAGQLGVAYDQLVPFTQVMGELGLSTDLTAQEAAVLTAQFANVTGMDFSNVRNFGSTIVDLGNNSATTESAILNMASRIAAAGSMAGISESDILGMSAALSSAGISAELGGTNFSRFISDVASAVGEGGADLETFAATAGMTADQFATTWGTNATGAITSFLQGLSGMDQATQLRTLNDLGLTGTEVQRVLLSMAGNTDLLTDSLTTASAAWSENTALAAEANTRLQTTESQFNVTKNTLRDLAITVGEALLPAINDLLADVRPIIERFSEWAAENPQLVQGIAAFAAGAAALGAVLVPLGMAIGAIGTVLGAILSPIGLVIAAVVALGAAFATNFGGIRDAVMPVIDAVGYLFGKIQSLFSGGWNVRGITGVISGLLTVFEDGSSFLSGFLKRLGMSEERSQQWATSFINGAKSVFDAVTSVFVRIVAAVEPVVSALAETFSNVFGRIDLGQIIQIGMTILSLTNPVGIVITTLKLFKVDVLGIFESLMAGVATFFETLNNGGTVFDGLKSVFGDTSFISGLQTAFEGFVGFIQDTVIPGLQNLAEWFLSDAMPVIDAVGSFVSGAVAAFQEGGLSSLGDFILEQLNAAAAAVGEYITSGQLGQDLISLGNALWGFIQSGISKIGDIGAWLFENVIQPLAAAAQEYVTSGQLMTDLQILGREFWNFIQWGIASIGDIGVWVFENVIQPLGAAFVEYVTGGQLMKDLNVLGREFWNFIQWGIASIGDIGVWVFENLIQPLATAVVNYVGSGQLWDDMVNLGSSLLDALISGIGNIGTWAYNNIILPLGNALAGLGTMVVDAINAAIPNEVNLGNLGPLGNVSINLPDNPIPGGSQSGGGGGGITTTATFENQLNNNPLLTGNLAGGSAAAGGGAPVTVNGVTINANSAEGGEAAADGFFNRLNELQRANG